VKYPTNYFNNKFQTLYTPLQDTAIDGSIIKLHGRLSFIQFNPSKQANFGIKYSKICEWAESWGSDPVVTELMAPYLSRGYNLYIDNWYSSQTH
jgi:hypothetical protein